MQTLLITGAESVVGANLAASLCERFNVILLTSAGTSIDGCQSLSCQPLKAQSVQQAIATAAPDAVIHCPAAAGPSWDESTAIFIAAEEKATTHLAAAAAAAGCPLVLVSSDRVYSGPWMFHDETSECWAPTRSAQSLRTMEQTVANQAECNLVIRTNALGWSSSESGFLERLVTALQSGQPVGYNHFATPLTTTTLADILARSLEAGLSGLYHAGGTERTNALSFAEGLATAIDLPHPTARPTMNSDLETSLHSGRLSHALGIRLPGLQECIDELQQQWSERNEGSGRSRRKLSSAA